MMKMKELTVMMIVMNIAIMISNDVVCNDDYNADCCDVFDLAINLKWF